MITILVSALPGQVLGVGDPTVGLAKKDLFDLKEVEPEVLSISEYLEKIYLNPTQENTLIGKKVRMQGAVYHEGRNIIIAAETMASSLDLYVLVQRCISSTFVAVAAFIGKKGADEAGLEYVKDAIQIITIIGIIDFLKDEMIDLLILAAGDMKIVGTDSQAQEYYDDFGVPPIMLIYPKIEEENLWAKEGSIIMDFHPHNLCNANHRF